MLGISFLFTGFFDTLYFKLTSWKKKKKVKWKEHLERKLSSGNWSLEITILRAQGPLVPSQTSQTKNKSPSFLVLTLLHWYSEKGNIQKEKNNNNILQWSFTWKNIHFGGAGHRRTQFRSSSGHRPTGVYFLFIPPWKTVASVCPLLCWTWNLF